MFFDQQIPSAGGQHKQLLAEADTPLQPSASRFIDRLTLVVILVLCAWLFSPPLRWPGPIFGFAQDDFYYYLKAAQNLASGHGSTFDGTTRTNGYHPLYFLLWTAASHVLHGTRAVFRMLWLLDMIAAASIFVAARTIFRKVTPSAFLWNAFAIIVLAPCVATISLQMETTLALPFGFAFVAATFVTPNRYTPRRCAVMGLLGGLTMMARLDAGILVFTFLVSLLTIREMRAVLRTSNMAAFASCALPLPLLYFGVNHFYFDRWLPVSGAAKQIRHGWKPDFNQLKLSFTFFSLVLLAVSMVCGAVAILLWRRFRPEEKSLSFATLLMPLIFYGGEALTSSWKFWGWYMYATRFAFLGAVVIVAVLLLRRSQTQASWLARIAERPWVGAAGLLGCVVAFTGTHYRHDPVMFNIAQEDIDLERFSRSHPGRYAMGDRAGMFAYLSASPVLQAEGLMMDSSYLDHIRRQDDLVSTLRQYGTNYYVYFVLHNDLKARMQGSCMQVEEPSLPGKDSMRMRSKLCDRPIAQVPGPDGDLYIYKLQ